jgi:hypothetical protein
MIPVVAAQSGPPAPAQLQTTPIVIRRTSWTQGTGGNRREGGGAVQLGERETWRVKPEDLRVYDRFTEDAETPDLGASYMCFWFAGAELHYDLGQNLHEWRTARPAAWHDGMPWDLAPRDLPRGPFPSSSSPGLLHISIINERPPWAINSRCRHERRVEYVNRVVAEWAQRMQDLTIRLEMKSSQYWNIVWPLDGSAKELLDRVGEALNDAVLALPVGTTKKVLSGGVIPGSSASDAFQGYLHVTWHTVDYGEAELPEELMHLFESLRGPGPSGRQEVWKSTMQGLPSRSAVQGISLPPPLFQGSLRGFM